MSTRFGGEGVPIGSVEVSAYAIPTDAPESDGTYEWSKTTLVLVEAEAGGVTGLAATRTPTRRWPGWSASCSPGWSGAATR